MSDDERKVFSHQLERIKLAEAQLEFARTQEMEARAWFFLAPMLPGISTLIASWKAEAATLAGLSALHELTLASDESFAIAWKEVDALEYAGAGENNYTGQAGGSYNRAQEIALSSSVKGSGEASSYAKALLLSRQISANLTSPETSTLSGQGGEFVSLLMSGDGGMLWLARDIRRDCISALGQMETEQKQLELLASQRQTQAESQLSEMKKKRYDLITGEITLDFLPLSSEASLPPRDALASFGSRVSGGGFTVSSKQFIDLAKSFRSMRLRGYLSNSIAKLGEALSLISETQADMEETDSLVELLLSSARTRLSSSLSSLDSAISSFSPSTEAERSLFLQAKSLRESADSKIKNAAYETPGTALASYSLALSEIETSSSLLSKDGRRVENMRDAAGSRLSKLCETVPLAEKDSVPVEIERAYCDDFTLLLDVADESLLAEIRLTAENYTASIYEKAGKKYANLDDERASISNALSGAIPQELDSYHSQFLEYELKFAPYGSLDPALTLGSYSKLDSFYSRLLDRIDQYKSSILLSCLERNTEFSLAHAGSPELDKPSGFTASASFFCQLGLFYQGQLSLEVKLPKGVASPTVVSKSEDVGEIAFSHDTMFILLKRVRPRTLYSIEMAGEKVWAKSVSKTDEVVSLTPAYLGKRVSVSFNSEADLDSMRAVLFVERMPSSHSATVNGIPASTDSFASASGSGSAYIRVQAEDVGSGRGSLILSYVIPQPFSVRRVDFRNVSEGPNTTIFFRVEVASDMDLEDVPVVISEPNASVVIVRGIGGAELRELKSHDYAGSTVIEWTIPKLSAGLPATYELYYLTSDIGAYFMRLREYVSNLARYGSYSWAGSELARADSLFSSGKTTDAIGALLALNERLSQASMQSSAPRGAVEAELSGYSENERLVRSIISSITSSGFDAGSSPFLLENASMLAASSLESYNEGRYLDALEQIGRAKGALDGIVYPSLSLLQANLSSRANEEKARAILLSSKFEMGDELALLSQAQSLLHSSSAYLSENKHGEALNALISSSLLISNASSSMRSASIEWASSLESALPAYSLLQSEIGKKAQSLSSMAQITETRVRGSKYEPPFSIDGQIQLSLASSSHIKNMLESLRASPDKASFVSQKAGNLVIAEQELGSLNSTLALIDSEISSLEKSSSSSYRNAELALKQLAEAVPTTEQLAKEESTLRDYMQDSETAMKEERHADSILLSTYVQSRASKLISASQPGKGGGFDSTPLLIALSLVFVAILAYLFVRRKSPPSEPEQRVLKRRKPATGNNNI